MSRIELTWFTQSRLVQGAGDLWQRATQGEFLSAVAEGRLPKQVFHRWLAQDYRFARELTSFQAIAVAKTPRPAQKILIAGLSALDAELDWFEDHARAENLDLNVPPHPTCRQYTDFLLASAYREPFQVLLAIVYGVEVSYLAAWSALEPEGPYAEFIARWSNQRFAQYVRDLLAQCDANRHPDQQARMNEVLQHEQAFWQMVAEG